MKKLILSALSLVLFASTIFAQPGPQGSDAAYIKDNYTKYEYQIPMRDGKKLFTSVYVPKDQSKKYPIMMDRTCYSVAPYGPDKYKTSLGPSPAFLHDGYIFVYQDVRGRWMSEGIYEEMTPEKENHTTSKDVDEGSDTYDTIDWLLKNVPNNNGNVGIYGISYDGWTAIIAATDPHPALKAVSEQATPSDMFMNDDFHHDGAFRLSYGFEYSVLTEAAKTDSLYNFGEYDTYDWYLRLGPLSNINKKYAHNTLPTWNNFIAHPNYDSFWQKQA